MAIKKSWIRVLEVGFVWFKVFAFVFFVAKEEDTAGMTVEYIKCLWYLHVLEYDWKHREISFFGPVFYSTGVWTCGLLLFMGPKRGSLGLLGMWSVGLLYGLMSKTFMWDTQFRTKKAKYEKMYFFLVPNEIWILEHGK